MTKEIAQKTTANLSGAAFDALTPLASRALFWRAQYMAASPVLGYLPFIFWLIENTRPTMAVTLGVGDAVAHFAICQATEKLGLETMCLAVGPPAGDAPGLQAVLNYNDCHYGDFSQIMQADHADAAESLLDTEIDLLAVNRPADQALLDEIDRHWLPRMSEKGVVLFTQGGNGAGYQAYVRRISHDGGVFTLNPADGACVVLRGAKQHDRLQRLVRLKMGKPGYLNVRSVFARLGELHSKANLLERTAREADKNRDLLDRKTTQIATLETQVSQLQDQVAKLVAKLKERLQEKATEIATAQVEIFELREAATARIKTAAENAAGQDAKLGAAEQEAGTWKMKAGQARQKAESQATEIDDLSARLETAEQDRDRLQKNLAEHDEALANRYDDIAALGLGIDEARQKAESQATEIDDLSARLEEREERITALETSTSWRVTSPLRRISLTLRGS